MPSDKHAPAGCLVGILVNLFGGRRGAPAKAALPYRRRAYLLSKAERSFYGVLLQSVDADVQVFCKVRLADVIEVPGRTPGWQSLNNKIISKHVDFLICDRRYVRPMLVIELDDSSHQSKERQARDSLVNEALAAAGLPILHVRAGHAYNTRELAEEIRQRLDAVAV